MRTTLDLPDALVQEAMQVTRIKTKKQLVTRALEELIKRERLTELKQYQGKIDLNIDLDVLRTVRDVLVDTSIWIGYFRSGKSSGGLNPAH
jgi:Arc/MetJ family transcription regulator